MVMYGNLETFTSTTCQRRFFDVDQTVLNKAFARLYNILFVFSVYVIIWHVSEDCEEIQVLKMRAGAP